MAQSLTNQAMLLKRQVGCALEKFSSGNSLLWAWKYRRRHKTTHPLGRFSKPGSSALRMILIPNVTFSESCQRDLSNDAVFGTDTLFDVEESSFEKSVLEVCCLLSPTVLCSSLRKLLCKEHKPARKTRI